jgi:hypothetical protein
MVFRALGKAFQLSTYRPEASLDTNQARTVANELFQHRRQSRFVLPRIPNALTRGPNALLRAPNALPRIPNALPQGSPVLPQASPVLPQASRVLPQVSSARAVISCSQSLTSRGAKYDRAAEVKRSRADERGSREGLSAGQALGPSFCYWRLLD